MTYSVQPGIVEALELGERYPLAKWKAWDHGPGRTSQLRALQAIVDNRTVLVWGGNKSGKSALNLALGCAYALGSDHPAVKSFLRINGLPADLIPPDPGVTWFLAPTFDDSKRYHRKRVGELLGVDFGDRGWSLPKAAAESTLEVSVPGHKTPATIVFKAHSQKVAGMKGDAIRYFGPDEECAQDMFNEGRKRLAEEPKGRCVFSMTNDPHSDIDWPKRRFVDNREKGSTNVPMWNEDNPHVPEGLLDELIEGSTDAEIAAAKYGDFTTVKGKVWPRFSLGAHVIEPHPIPEDWPMYGGADFGFNDPNVLLWGATDDDGIIEVYREFYITGVAVSVFAGQVKATTEDEGESFIEIYCDSSKLQDYAEMCESGLPASPAHRVKEEGITAVGIRFANKTIRIHRSCIRLLRELENYRRRNGKIVKRNDHACDALRYLVKGIDNDAATLGDWGGGLRLSELETPSVWKT